MGNTIYGEMLTANEDRRLTRIFGAAARKCYSDICSELAAKLPDKKEHFRGLQREIKGYHCFDVPANLKSTVQDYGHALDERTLAVARYFIAAAKEV